MNVHHSVEVYKERGGDDIREIGSGRDGMNGKDDGLEDGKAFGAPNEGRKACSGKGGPKESKGC